MISLDQLKGVPRTLLLPLRGRYLETKKAGGILNDPMSVKIIDSIEHDFSERELPWDGQMLISARTKILDDATEKFLKDNPDCIVVNLGCGLDTRFHRLDNGKVQWYDLDLCESIELRSNFFEQTDRYKFIARSVLDFSWMDLIPKNKKTLFIAEGLLIYFSEDEVKKIVLTIKEHFGGSEMILEAYSRVMRRSWHRHPEIRKAFSMFKWAIETGKSMETWGDGIRFIDEWHYLDVHPRRWRWIRFFRYIRRIHRAMKIIHLQLNWPSNLAWNN